MTRRSPQADFADVPSTRNGFRAKDKERDGCGVLTTEPNKPCDPRNGDYRPRLLLADSGRKGGMV